MHETLSDNFIGYIDNLYVENENLRISGWLITKHNRDDIVYYADIGHSFAFYNYNERQDVADFYKSEDLNYNKCGFDISVPWNNKNEIEIFALVKGQKEVIYKLGVNSNSVTTIESSHIDESYDIKINQNVCPGVIVVDNFYENPDQVRQLALQQSYAPDLRYHKGQRTQKKFLPQGLKEVFESFIGKRITKWVDYEYNGIFQFCTAQDPLVYHSDVQNYAGAIYLTPDAPPESGTSFFRSKQYPNVRKCHISESNYPEIFKGGFYDKTKFELIDTVGNVYNRLVLWDARLIHSASQYFGQNKEDSRLFHLFFFDVEE